MLSGNLDFYLQRTVKELYPKLAASTPIQSISSRLDKTQPNHILIFRGAFNPPHLGHLRVLAEAYYHHNTDLHIVAAIIVPMDNDFLLQKNSDVGERFLLPEQCSSNLWKNDKRSPKWAWVFDLESHEDIPYFARQLAAFARADGYTLSFIHLRGAENFKPKKPLGWLAECDTMLTTNIGRQSSNISLTAQPKVVGFGDWRAVPRSSWSAVWAADRVTQDNLPSLMVLDLYAAPLTPTSNSAHAAGEMSPSRQTIDMVRKLMLIRSCHTSHTHFAESHTEPGHRVYFVNEPNPSPNDLSSSLVRQLIRHESIDSVYESLRNRALSPELLVTYLASDDSGIRITDLVKKMHKVLQSIPDHRNYPPSPVSIVLHRNNSSIHTNGMADVPLVEMGPSTISTAAPGTVFTSILVVKTQLILGDAAQRLGRMWMKAFQGVKRCFKHHRH